jgi:glutamyl-tRNA reductase
MPVSAMLFVVGANHKTAPLATRERLAVAPTQVAARLDLLLEAEGIREAVVLTTCNRTELYAVADAHRKRRLVEWLAASGTSDGDLQACLYTRQDGAAARHLFRVTAGLDSMVPVEAQILGQVKTAYLQAHRASAVGPELHQLFQHAFEAAKGIRGDTALNGPRSLPYAAVKLAAKRLGGLRGKTALVVGAGKTAETLSFHLRAHRIGRLAIANRSRAAARALAANFGGEALALEAIPEALSDADLLASATSAEVALIDADSLAERPADKPLLILDLAVPRDVAPEVAALAEVSLLGVDDLAGTIAASAEMRDGALRGAEERIERALARWHRARRIRTAVPTICALRAEAAHVRRQTLAEARRIGQSRGSDAALEYLAATLTNRLIHAPTVRLREAAAHDETALLAAAQDLFALDPEDKHRDSEAA